MKSFLVMLVALFVAAGSFAQKSTPSTTTKTTAQEQYACPMHPEVTSTKAGTCSKCGMALEKTQKAAAQTFTCPMHPDVKSDKAGKCPSCHMDLVEAREGNKKN